MFSNHVTKELSAYCNGELTQERSREVAEHIISCAGCRSEFEEIKFGVQLAEQLPQMTAPDHLWSKIEAALPSDHDTRGKITAYPAAFWPRRRQLIAIAACLIVAAFITGFWFLRQKHAAPLEPSWQVAALNGRPSIGSTRIADKGRLGIGQWLETDQDSRAQISVASIGEVEVDPNTRIRLIQTRPTEHRLELARGRMSARIWAPPRLFFVDTPSAIAADLGCAYTLDVDDSGGSLLRVTSGWVALQLNDRESVVPAGAACQTRPGIGPGTPYFDDAPVEFISALAELDFGEVQSAKREALNRVLRDSRVKDTLTLWHLVPRVNGDDRRRVYEKIINLVEPPVTVTREGVMNLDQETLKNWKDKLEFYWVGSVIDPASAPTGLSKSGKLLDGTKIKAK